MPERITTPPTRSRSIRAHSPEVSSSSEEEDEHAPVPWHRDELELILFKFDRFILSSRPPLAPFPRGSPPERLCHRVAKSILREYDNWRHSIQETAKMLRREIHRRDAPPRTNLAGLHRPPRFHPFRAVATGGPTVIGITDHNTTEQVLLIFSEHSQNWPRSFEFRGKLLPKKRLPEPEVLNSQQRCLPSISCNKTVNYTGVQDDFADSKDIWIVRLQLVVNEIPPRGWTEIPNALASSSRGQIPAATKTIISRRADLSQLRLHQELLRPKSNNALAASRPPPITAPRCTLQLCRLDRLSCDMQNIPSR
ncbi:6979_t:CDS:2 [Ambispora gerdemannii]|uniref:6979_t:CDS:1 n=1 Tax=Ambispora gerdemannii TaxID=144530 RepID=A0A9N8UYI9_9GLOM|nr:6979_t:CDS:2 [Ambispora gerdemannii]